MKNIEVGTKIKLEVENIIVEVIGVYDNKVRYQGTNGERGILNANLIKEEQIITEEKSTILEAIQKKFEGYNVVVKSKEAQVLVNENYKGIKLSSNGENEIIGYIVNDPNKILWVETFANGNARVRPDRLYN